MPKQVQVAIQGGGAKFVTLLPVMAALQQLEADEEIKITRVAGTSAGAIAAALLANHTPVNNIIDALRSNRGDEIKKEFCTPTLRNLLWNVCYRKKPLWSDAPLVALLNQFIGVNTQFSDIKSRTGVDLTLVHTSLDSRDKSSVKEGNVVEEVLHSCGLPFLFRIWDSTNQVVKIDGGLCDNLPISELMDEEETLGPVLGISFAPKKIEKNDLRPRTFWSFIGAMIDTVVSHPVATARRLVPKSSVFFIETELDYKDFEQALQPDYLGGDQYRTIYTKAISFFRDYLSVASLRPMDLGDDPWACSDQLALKLMERVQKFQKVSLSDTSINRLSAELILVLRSLADQDADDELTSVLDFEVKGHPLGSYSFGVNLCVRTDHVSGAGTFRGESVQWRIFQNNKPCPVDVTWLPALDFKWNEETKQMDMVRRVVLLFSPPLPISSNPYQLVVVYSVKKFLPRLSEPGGDECAFTSSQGAVSNVKVVVYLPNQRSTDFHIWLPTDLPFKATQLSPIQAAQFERPVPGFTPHVAVGENLLPNQRLALKITPLDPP